MKTKLPVALLVTAGIIAGASVLGSEPDAAPTPLPDPVEMLANGYGYDSFEATTTMWRARVEADGADQLSRTNLGVSLLGLARENGDPSLYLEAEAELRTAVADAPLDASARLGLASSLTAQHEFREALSVLQEIADERPDDLGILAAMIDAHLDLGEHPAAFALLDDLAQRLPDSPATLSRLARRAALTGDLDGAVAFARSSLVASAALDLRPSDAAGAWFQLGYFEFQAGRLVDADESLRSALVIVEDHLPSRELLGKVLVAQGRLDEAVIWYEELVADSPAADLHGLLGEIYSELGRDGEAAEQVRLGEAIVAEQVGAFPAERRHLATFIADIDPERFLDLMEQDVATRRDIAGLDLLAWAHHLNGNRIEAAAIMDEALALGTRDASMSFHAGMIALADGDRDAAREHLQAALELNPGFDLGDARIAREALDDL